MPRGFGGGGFRGGGFRGGYRRRGGSSMVSNSGAGTGSPLLTGLMGGGLGYLLGSSRGNQQVQEAPQQQTPPPPAPATPPATASADELAQLKLLGELHASGVLTDEEFALEKKKILDR